MSAVRVSIVASISACHAEDPGSIPGLGVFANIFNLFVITYFFMRLIISISFILSTEALHE